jgi:hypothetical protein
MFYAYIAGFIFSAVLYDTLFVDKDNFGNGKLLAMAALWPLTMLFVVGVGAGAFIKNECLKANIEP